MMDSAKPGLPPGASPLTLVACAVQYWRSFLWIWLFPIIFLFGGQGLANVFGYETATFWLLWMPLFFWSFYRPRVLVQQQKISIAHLAIWGIVVPFIIWVIVVEARLGVLALWAARS